MHWIDYALFVVFALNALYIVVYALASVFKPAKTYCKEDIKRRIAVLIPAYKEDRVIFECVQSMLAQDYPVDKLTVAVISDHMKEETNESLSNLPIKLVVAQFENSTKSKALNLAMSTLDDHDIAVVFDADNTIEPDFLNRINPAFSNPKVNIVQAHRTAKNLNTNLAYLDAASEEINNSIFRQGHVNLGLSASFIGSGMAFDYQLFKNAMSKIKAVGGFDRDLMLALLKQGYHVGYLPDAYVYDEKVQSSATFSNQRKRWLSAQFHYVGVYLKDFLPALFKGNWDFCDMYVQQLVLPRVILVGFTFFLALGASVLPGVEALKWWILFGLVAMALLISIPRRFMSLRLLAALVALPETFFRMFLNFFKLKGANKKFIHTPHGTN